MVLYNEMLKARALYEIRITEYRERKFLKLHGGNRKDFRDSGTLTTKE
jgi:hypothetical protein